MSDTRGKKTRFRVAVPAADKAKLTGLISGQIRSSSLPTGGRAWVHVDLSPSELDSFVKESKASGLSIPALIRRAVVVAGMRS